MTDNENKIEDIKRRLYDVNEDVVHRQREGVLHPVNHRVEDEWNHKKEENMEKNFKKPKTSIFKKIFITSIIFFIGALGFAFYMFYTGGVSVSNENIDIRVIGNAFTKGGEELPLQIEIINRNKASLELSNLIISYPSGASDNISDYVRLPRLSIGTIKPGETITKNIKVVLYGDERSSRNVKIELEYHPEGSNAIFTKEMDYGVNISSAPLSLSIDAPDSIASDQPISINVNATLNTSLPEGDTVLEVTYPNNFVFESATPAPSFGSSMWDLNSISVGNPVSININGRIIGQENDEQVFHVYAGTVNPNNKSKVSIVYNSLLHPIVIVKPFIEANILVDDTASSGEKLSGRISWSNNLSTKITNGQIILTVGGNALDRMSVSSSEGFFDSMNNKIVWDRNTNPELAEIEPGERGDLDFTFKSISVVGSQIAKDPQVTLDVSIKGQQSSFGSMFTDINNFSKKIVKIVSDFQIATGALYSSGSMPPKAENETRYNITWTVSNSSNTVNEAVARAALPVYVKWVGSLSPRENIIYNETTREVIWNIGTVKPTTTSGYSKEVTFTIALNPSVAQIGSIPQLVKDLYLTGRDTFTGTILNDRRSPITTQITNDPNFQFGQERVIQ